MIGYDAGGGLPAGSPHTAEEQTDTGLLNEDAPVTSSDLKTMIMVDFELSDDLIQDLRSQLDSSTTITSTMTAPEGAEESQQEPLKLTDVEGSIVRPEQPCCIELKQENRLGENIDICEASPTGSVHLSNRNENRNTYYINGMKQSPQMVTEDVQALTAVTGDNVRAIINNNSQNFWSEVTSAVMGYISPVLGHWAEPSAVEGVMDAIESDVKEGKQVRIFAFSQGGIIASNALELLHDKLSETEWEKVKENVEVIAAGSGTYMFPEGIQTCAMVHSADMVPKLTGQLSGIRSMAAAAISFFSGTKQVEMHQSNVIEINGKDEFSKAHRFSEYMEHMPDFLLKAHTKNGELQVDSFTKAVVGIAANGDFADHVIQHLLERAEEHDSSELMRALQKYAPSGKIGSFQIPQMRKEEWEMPEAA